MEQTAVFGLKTKGRENKMIELGKRQKLTVVKEVDFGIYLGDEKERVAPDSRNCRPALQ